MNGRLNKNIGFSLIVFSFFFIFEPNYSLLDLIPDFIGHILLCIAIINMADINHHVSDAFKGFRSAAIVNTLRIVAVFMLKRHFVDDEQTLGTLICAFVFAIADIAILIPAFKNLFTGLLSLGMHHDGRAIYFAKNDGAKNATEKIHGFTAVFIVLKNIIGIMPEFTSLIEDTSYEFVGLLRTFSVMIMMPLSLVWLIMICRYFIRVKRDKDFIENISHVYLDKVESNPQFYTVRVLRVGLTGLLVAVLLSFDVFLDNSNIIPDFIFYAVLFLSSVFLYKHSKKWILLAVSSILGVGISIWLNSSMTSFFELHTVEAIRRDIEAYNAYNGILGQSIAESVIFALSVAFVMLIIGDIYKHHSGIGEAIGRDLQEMKRSFAIYTVAVSASGLLTACAGVYYVVSMPFTLKGWLYQHSNIVSGAVSIAFILIFYLFVSAVKSAICQNYRCYLD